MEVTPVTTTLVRGTTGVVASWLAGVLACWLACWLLLAAYRTLHMLWLSRSIPGLPPFRIVLRLVMGMQGHPTAMLGKIMTGYKTYGSAWRLWFGPFLAVFIREPDDVQEVLSNPASQDKPPLYESIAAILGPGLININGDTFRRHRKALAPSFQMEVLRSFAPLFNGAGVNLCEEFEVRAREGETFNSAVSFKRVTTDVVLEAFLCCTKADLKEQREGIAKAINQVNEMMMYFVQRPWYWKRFVRQLIPPDKQYGDMVSFVDFCARTAIEKKLAEVKNGTLKVNGESNGVNGTTKDMLSGSRASGPIIGDQIHRKALLDHIVSSGNFRMLDKEELVAEVKHICAAALATTADLLSFLAICLAQQPEVQERAYAELMEVFDGDVTRPVTMEDLDRLEYLERVIMEVLRWFPAVPGMARHAKGDIKLPSGGVIPRGSYIVIILRAVHMNERYHADPYAFNPDRFLPENLAGIPKYAYLPFSDGTRACPGKRWGILYTKILAAVFLRQYRFLPDPGRYKTLRDVKTVMGISLQPVGGANVRVEKRPAAAAAAVGTRTFSQSPRCL